MNKPDEDNEAIKRIEYNTLKSFSAVKKDILSLKDKLEKSKRDLEGEFSKGINSEEKTRSRELEKVKNKINNINSKIRDIDRINEKLSNIEDVLSEYKDLGNKINIINQRLTERLNSLKKNFVKNQDFNDNNTAIEEEFESINREIDELKKNNRKLNLYNEKIKGLTKNISSIEKKSILKKELTAKLAGINRRIDLLSDKLKETTDVFVEEIAKLNYNNVKKKELNKEVKFIKEELNSVNKELDSIRERTVDKSSASRDRATSRRERKLLNSQLNIALVKLDKSNQEIKRLDNKINTESELRDAKLRRLEQKLAYLNRKLNNAYSTINELSNVKVKRQREITYKNRKTPPKKPSKKYYLILLFLLIGVVGLFAFFNFPKLFSHVPVINNLTNMTQGSQFNYTKNATIVPVNPVQNETKKNISNANNNTNISANVSEENKSVTNKTTEKRRGFLEWIKDLFRINKNPTNTSNTGITQGANVSNMNNITNKTKRNITINNTKENITINNTEKNISNVAKEQNASSISKEENINKNLSEEELKKKTDDCILEYECKKINNDTYLFNCYYDMNEGKCRCYQGNFEKCNIEKLAKLQSERKPWLKKAVDYTSNFLSKAGAKIAKWTNQTVDFVLLYKGYTITGLVLLLILLIILYDAGAVKSLIINFFTREKKTRKKRKG